MRDRKLDRTTTDVNSRCHLNAFTNRQRHTNEMTRTILIISALTLASCASSRNAPRGGDQTTASRMTTASGAINTDTAMAIMRRLEAAPLAAGATAERQRVFEWLASTDQLEGIAIDGRYLDKLESTEYPFAGELLMQFAFGIAMHRVSLDGVASEHIDEVEAGLRSAITAYRNIVQTDFKLADKFLEDLDQIRRLGRLRAYIEKVDEQNR